MPSPPPLSALLPSTPWVTTSQVLVSAVVCEALQHTTTGKNIYSYFQGWPGPYVCTVYDRIFGDFPAKNTVYTVPYRTHPAPPPK